MQAYVVQVSASSQCFSKLFRIRNRHAKRLWLIAIFRFLRCYHVVLGAKEKRDIRATSPEWPLLTLLSHSSCRPTFGARSLFRLSAVLRGARSVRRTALLLTQNPSRTIARPRTLPTLDGAKSAGVGPERHRRLRIQPVRASPTASSILRSACRPNRGPKPRITMRDKAVTTCALNGALTAPA